jgi:tetratricopeptide (TPR) repeat protein
MEGLIFDKESQELYEQAAELATSQKDILYAVFLCQEILQRDPDHLRARQLLMHLRESGFRKTKRQKLIILSRSLGKLLWLLFQFKKKKRECLIALDSLLDVYLKWEMVWRLMSRLAIQLEYFNTAIFCIENINRHRRKMSDIIRLGEAYLGCGHFTGAVEVANFILEKDPENIKAKDLLWQSSIEDTLGKQSDTEASKEPEVKSIPTAEDE